MIPLTSHLLRSRSLIAGALALTPLVALASSHREAPAITEDPTVDCTDVYAFVSPDQTDTVTLVANYIPLEDPSGGPNWYRFSDNALYEIHVDNDGDGQEDVTFQFRFTTETRNADRTPLIQNAPVAVAPGGNDYTNLNVIQRYTLTRIDGDRRTGTKTVLAQNLLVAPNNIGPKTMPDYPSLATAATHTLSNGIRAFAGPRDDPFFIHLGRSFDLVNIDPVLPGGQAAVQGATIDTLAGFNCHSLVLQVPKSQLVQGGVVPTEASAANAVIGIWSTASRPQVQLRRSGGRGDVVGGAFVQVSRLGMPLMNELIVGLTSKNKFNNSEPKDDAQFTNFAEDPALAGALVALFGGAGLTVPPAPRNDLVQVFFEGVPGLNKLGSGKFEYLRLNVAIPPSTSPDRLGVLAGQLDGFPNGRRLGDDVVDIALRVVHGVLVDGATFNLELGDTVPANDRPFLSSFPYLALPHDGVTRQRQSEPVAR